jgi:hypothetical protein
MKCDPTLAVNDLELIKSLIWDRNMDLRKYAS